MVRNPPEKQPYVCISRGSAENGRDGGFYRYGACAGSEICDAARQYQRLYVPQPDTGEQALNCETLVCPGRWMWCCGFGGCTCSPFGNRWYGILHGVQARLMSQALRKLSARSSNQTAVIFINQLRLKIGVRSVIRDHYWRAGTGILFFGATDIRRINSIKSGAEVVGSRVRVGWQRTVAPPFWQPNSISCTTKEFPEPAILLIWEHNSKSLPNGFVLFLYDIRWARGARMQRFLKANPELAMIEENPEAALGSDIDFVFFFRFGRGQSGGRIKKSAAVWLTALFLC